jgi:hypothetical protein
VIFYSQSKGEFSRTLDGPVPSTAILFGGCYAGMGTSKNNPADQCLRDRGPLPRGEYFIGPLQKYPHLGPAMQLLPLITNNMCGRGGFYVHLDNLAHVGMSSDGCCVCMNDFTMFGDAKLLKLDALRAAGETMLTVTE